MQVNGLLVNGFLSNKEHVVVGYVKENVNFVLKSNGSIYWTVIGGFSWKVFS